MSPVDWQVHLQCQILNIYRKQEQQWSPYRSPRYTISHIRHKKLRKIQWVSPNSIFNFFIKSLWETHLKSTDHKDHKLSNPYHGPKILISALIFQWFCLKSNCLRSRILFFSKKIQPTPDPYFKNSGVIETGWEFPTPKVSKWS